MTSINTGGMELNLQLIKNMSNASVGSKNNSTNTGAVYAREGEPMYQKDMDADEDGVITFQEFNDYCDENDISYAERKQMLQNRLEFQLNSDRARVSAEIKEIKPEGDAVYAKEGDKNYDKEIDENSDGKITYDEYMRYCEENEKAKEKQQPEKAETEEQEKQFTVKNDGKAINTYIKNENAKEQTKVEKEV